MKISAIFLMLLAQSPIFACQRPTNLRDGDNNLMRLRELHKLGETKMYILNYAIAWDDVEALKILFSCGKEIKYEDENLYQTDRPCNEILISLKPLHLAAQYGSLQVIAFCLEHKAPVNSRTYCEDKEHHEQTPAHWAAIHGQAAALSKLLEAGADPMLKDARSRTIVDIVNQKEDVATDSVLQEYMAKKTIH